MTVKQLPRLLGRLVEHGSALMGLPTADADWAAEHPKAALKLWVAAIMGRDQTVRKGPATCSRAKPRLPDNRLRPFHIIDVPRLGDDFLVESRFMNSAGSTKGVKVFPLNKEMSDWFGTMRLQPQTMTTICSHELLESMTDGAIYSALCAHGSVLLTLAEIFWLLEQQKHGHVGALSVKSNNLFFVQDERGRQRLIIARWEFGHNWRLSACDYCSLSSAAFGHNDCGGCTLQVGDLVFARKPLP